MERWRAAASGQLRLACREVSGEAEVCGQLQCPSKSLHSWVLTKKQDVASVWVDENVLSLEVAMADFPGMKVIADDRDQLVQQVGRPRREKRIRVLRQRDV